MAGKSRKGQGQITWTRQTLAERCDEIGECLIWNRGLNSAGYPVTTINGIKGTSVRRFVYVELYGKTLQPRNVIAPKCGHTLCLAEGCLVQMTRAVMSSRSIDRLRKTPHGMYSLQRRAVKAGHAKLDAFTAAEIRASELPANVLAELHGVSARSIRRIRSGQHWAQSRVPTSIFNLGG